MVRRVQAPLDPREISRLTRAAYEPMAEAYREETHTRDRTADHALLFRHLSATGPLDLLDLGCGPGHDLAAFQRLGHRAVGLDGSAAFVAMAQARSTSPVLHQDLLTLSLPTERFHAIYASASLFHVPLAALHDVLTALARALRSGGILFALNPRGQNETGWIGDRYCWYLRLPTWRKHLREAGFVLLEHEYRPVGLPRRRQQWIASVAQKT